MITFLNTSLGNIAFDAVLNEDIEASSVITSNPLENGAESNDHIYANPKVYSLEAGVSNTPLNALTSDIFLSANSQVGSSGAGRRNTAWELLNQLHILGEPFTVQAGLETMDNMAIANLKAPNNARVAGSLIFSATLVQLLFVNTEESQLTEAQLSGEAKQQAASNKAKGKVTKEEKTPQSFAFQLANIFGAGL